MIDYLGTHYKKASLIINSLLGKGNKITVIFLDKDRKMARIFLTTTFSPNSIVNAVDCNEISGKDITTNIHDMCLTKECTPGQINELSLKILECPDVNLHLSVGFEFINCFK